MQSFFSHGVQNAVTELLIGAFHAKAPINSDRRLSNGIPVEGHLIEKILLEEITSFMTD